MLMLPLWDVYSHPEHLLLEVLLVVTERTPEEEEAGTVRLTLTHKHRQVNHRYATQHLQTNCKAVDDLQQPVSRRIELTSEHRTRTDSRSTCTQSRWNQLAWQDGHLSRE